MSKHLKNTVLSILLLGFVVFGYQRNKSTDWDPRNRDAVKKVINKREVDRFREMLISRDPVYFIWPGLRSMQLSYTWLETVQGLHVESSYQGDFSWLFAKLYKIVKISPRQEIKMVSALAPFFFVIGEDEAGRTLFMNEMLQRAPHLWKSWFWSGFHAMDNMRDPKLAADLLNRSLLLGAPPFVAALILRLKYGDHLLDDKAKRKLLIESLPKQMVNSLKKTRPEWFKEEITP